MASSQDEEGKIKGEKLQLKKTLQEDKIQMETALAQVRNLASKAEGVYEVQLLSALEHFANTSTTYNALYQKFFL